MKEKHLLSLKDFSAPELEEIFDLASRMKADPAAYSRTLEGKSLAMIFQKPSTRTRVSFEVGMFQLGGQAMFLGSEQIQIMRGESIDDTAKVLSGYVDGILARVHSHEDLLNLARHGTVPVINGLSDLVHPVQAISDFFTLRELKGDLAVTKMAYLGDGNNMCHALLLGAVKLGVSIEVATPAGYEPNPLMVKSAVRDAQKGRTPPPTLTQDPRSAIAGADCVYTDVWTSMGQEAETEARRAAFEGFCVTPELMSLAKPDAVFMHCLPAHRGEEVAAEVIDGPQSVVFLQSQNRLHVQKAILALLLGGRLP
jgi:ornithine carbamoyltransferase